jgi:hypothetical protein
MVRGMMTRMVVIEMEVRNKKKIVVQIENVVGIKVAKMVQGRAVICTQSCKSLSHLTVHTMQIKVNKMDGERGYLLKDILSSWVTSR